MKIDTFLLERNQSLYENQVELNLTESGIEPLTLSELLTPEEQAALAKVRLGYNYTEGTPAVRAAIASWYPGATADNVLVTTGASEANFLATWALAKPGSGVAFMLPNFMQIHGLAKALGADVRTFALKRELGWRPDLAEYAAAVTPATKLIAICNPNNPTGAVLNAEDTAAIIDGARKADAWLLSDEVYRGSETDGRAETPTLWGQYEKTIITSSTSKSMAHAGLRVGWIVAPADFIAEMMRRQDYTTIGTGPLNQHIASIILSSPRRDAVLAEGRAVLGKNLKIIDDWIERWNGKLRYDRPAAGGMVFVAYDFPIGSSELSRILREEESTFVVAGDWFGLDGHLRIGTGGHAHELEEGLKRIDRVLGRL
ncbi:Capreomycidine synthase [Alphaproteobacteria bacterium SO-S41]|nr:Capreomycidine synthase [Alphaproteobacteria bacterium SO-S41]